MLCRLAISTIEAVLSLYSGRATSPHFGYFVADTAQCFCISLITMSYLVNLSPAVPWIAHLRPPHSAPPLGQGGLNLTTSHNRSTSSLVNTRRYCVDPLKPQPKAVIDSYPVIEPKTSDRGTKQSCSSGEGHFKNHLDD